MTACPHYRVTVQGLTGLPMKLKLIDMVTYGFQIEAFDPDDSPRMILLELEQQGGLQVAPSVRSECLEIISAYLCGLRAIPMGVPLQ